MLINTMMLWGILIFLIAMAAGAIVLQIFLSRRESRWPGLVLPALSALNALLPALGLLFYADTGVNGARIWTTAGTSCLIFNIPTVVLLAVYCACRRSRGRREELERMRAQDLE